MLKPTTFLICLALALGACGRAANVGRAPQLSQPQQSEEFMAMTNPPLEIEPQTDRPEAAASLWEAGSNSLIGDRRARQRGDILTVVIQIDDKAEMTNSSGRSRAAGDNVSIPAMAGIPQRLNNKLPEGASMDEMVNAKSSSTYKGSGNVSRREKLTLRIAATVLDTLPNGVLKIQGTQEVRVNYELRELTVSGFVRPSDIDRRNEIEYDRIAGARISYGGRGQITDVQQPRYGQQIADIVLPY